MARLWSWLLPLVVAAPLLGVSSCVHEAYYIFEYELDSCPPRDFDLPERVSFAGWELHAVETAPYCHGYTRYELTELREPRPFFDEPKQRAAVYAHVDTRGPTCMLMIATDSFCANKESLEDCAKVTARPGVFPLTKPHTSDFADTAAARLLVAPKFKAKMPAVKSYRIGEESELKRWCRERSP
jgi:hypothetical protein